ncbi:uncharacterized protein LOC121265427 isoform X2 [Juglans microcarpa x Juglans regia]|uniref:uncharacterized protein LOC121265427 isoform X2 n=1 Tax=Juglans microcarpa x Juglans regia TaxID=2249226 RepID=UPI001B7DBE45|nr:uncharacterized protein LOC121265427 isoform X2 [Juglans microcarpa x Juglans regia]
MGSSLLRWESDPLFSAAEVVQDSVDRMESIFRLLLHEQSLQDEHPDPKLLLSINYHRRDLATTLETAKWQLEDFERAVNLSSVIDKSQRQEDVVSRHKQFVRAIREQIIHVQKSLEDASLQDTVTNTEWVNLDEQDRDRLALFLSGGKPTESLNRYDLEDSSILRRFLDPNTTSSSKDTAAGLAEHSSREIESLHINGVSHIDHNSNKLRKVGSYFTPRLGCEAPDFLQETSCNIHGEDGSWDLEADEPKPKSFFHENKLRALWGRLNSFGFLNNLRTACRSTVSRNYTKRLKDGEEQRHSSSYADVSHGAQGQQMGMQMRMSIGSCWARYQKSPVCVRVNQHLIRLILIILFTVVILGVLVSQIA